MKIALLSFHDAYNYGAALQAYGLQYAVNNLGYDCEYINYKNEKRRYIYDGKHRLIRAIKNKRLIPILKALVGLPVLKRRGRAFQLFYNKNLKTTSTIYYNHDDLREISDSYDKYIVGSDQVWNNSHTGDDFAYLLDFVTEDKKRISYSSSFGVDSIPKKLQKDYASNLSHFANIAVREKKGVELVKQLTGRTAQLVLDPVFLVDREEWIRIKGDEEKKSKPYIFFYTNRQSQILEFLNTGYAQNEDYHVLSTHVSIKDILNPRMKMRVDMTPERFLSEIFNAEFVVTASFHCLAFAIIFQKPFCAILTGDEGKDERIRNLLKITGLSERILKSDTNEAVFRKEIDYDSVQKRIDYYLTESKKYLACAIDSQQYDVKELIPDLKRFCSDNRCVGCSACVYSCPHEAISLVADSEGFYYPRVNEEKCINCSVCQMCCPVYKETEEPDGQRLYAVKNSKDIRLRSSSGGVFRAIAREVINRGGVVCAAVMDENFHVYHTFADTMDKIELMGRTFYVQSDLNDCYLRIREIVKTKEVLFVGTPCQVAGLKSFLGNKKEQLLTCDLLCHGVPSPMVFESFIKDLQTRGSLEKFMFRDKTLGWKGYHVSAIINGKKIHDKLWLQSFNNLFSHNIINRQSCSVCPYTNYNRVGDITIGDFWGINSVNPEFSDQLGVSLVLTNTMKGEVLFNGLDNLEILEVEKEQTLQNSLNKPAKVSSQRMLFFQLLRKKGYRVSARKYAEVNLKGFIKNTVRKIMIK